MKKTIVNGIVSGLMMIPAIVLAQQDEFIIKGKVGNLSSPSKVYLAKGLSSKMVVDSAVLNNGAFEFKGHTDIAKRVTLVIAMSKEALGNSEASAGPSAAPPGYQPPDFKMFYLDKGVTEINSTDLLVNMVITGASLKVNNEDAELQAALEPLTDKYFAVGQFMENAPEAVRKTAQFEKDYNAKIAEVDNEQKTILATFIKAHHGSPVSLDALASYAGMANVPVTDIRALYNTFSDTVKNSSSGNALNSMLVRMEKTGIGSMAPDFAENNVYGKPVKLSSFRGKYVLLDFWASWCVPCRHENPNVIKAYNKYKNKNFTVLSISLDKNKAAWLQAIKKDQMTWTHLSNLKDFNGPAAHLYEISAIPTNFLIDPQGKIIAKNLRGTDLDEVLQKVFTN